MSELMSIQMNVYMTSTGVYVQEFVLSLNFRHKFSLLVVGPSEIGKTCFVQPILENNRIVYEEQRNIHTGGSELVTGGIAGADSLKSVDG